MKHEQNKEKTDYRSLAPEHDGITLTESQENLLGYFMYRYIGYSEQRANNDEWFFISYRDFVDHIGGSYSTLHVNIHQLFKYGFIERAQTKKRQANLYRITEPYRTHFYDIPVIEGVADSVAVQTTKNESIEASVADGVAVSVADATSVADGVAVQTTKNESIKASVADGVAVSVADATSVADGVAVQTTKNESIKASVADSVAVKCSTDTETEKETDLEKDLDLDLDKRKNLEKENKQMKKEIEQLQRQVVELTNMLEDLKGAFGKLTTLLNTTASNVESMGALPCVVASENVSLDFNTSSEIEATANDSQGALWDDWRAFRDRIECMGFKDGDSSKFELFKKRVTRLYTDTAKRNEKLNSITKQFQHLRKQADEGILSAPATSTDAMRNTVTPSKAPTPSNAYEVFKEDWQRYIKRFDRLATPDKRSQYYTLRSHIEGLPLSEVEITHLRNGIDERFAALMDGTFAEKYSGNQTPETLQPIPTANEDGDGLPF